MTERRVIKQRSQKVWDAAKAAYLAGEPAASVARRFDVGYGNLRHRAYAQGWTRKAHMAAVETREAEEEALIAGEAATPARAAPGAVEPGPIEPGPIEPGPIEPGPVVTGEAPPPRAAMIDAIQRASGLLARGRSREAEALLRAAQALGRAVEASPELSRPPRQADPALRAKITDLALRNADAMLSETFEGRTWAFSLPGFHWRARRFGPDVARQDFLRYRDEHYGDHCWWDEDGRLIPLETVDPDGLMSRTLDEGDAAFKVLWAASPEELEDDE